MFLPVCTEKRFAKMIFKVILHLFCMFIQLVNLQTLPKQFSIPDLKMIQAVCVLPSASKLGWMRWECISGNFMIFVFRNLDCKHLSTGVQMRW